MNQIKKLANAFYVDAEPSDTVKGLTRYSIERYKKKHGGLWVGGGVVISSKGISFSPNFFNRNFHKELKDIYIPQETIKSVEYKFAWFTGIVEVHHDEGVFKFRCYGAKKLVDFLNNKNIRAENNE